MKTLYRSIGAAAVALALLAQMALPARASVAVTIQNNLGHRARISVHASGSSGCIGDAQAGRSFTCANIASPNSSVSVRAEIVDASGHSIGVAGFSGVAGASPHLTLYTYNGRYTITAGRPRGSTM